jgi:hypothetical protein
MLLSSEKMTKIFSVIPRLDRGIQKKALDYPVKPDNDIR